MKGSIRKRGNTYQYRISYKEGEKRKYIEKGGFKLKKECELAMNKAIDEINTTGSITKIKIMLFGEVFKEYMEKEAPLTKKLTTLMALEAIYAGNLKEPFENVYMHQIKISDIQKLYLNRMNEVTLSYMNNIHNLLNNIFKYALKMNYVKSNVVEKVTKYKDKTKKNEIVIYTDEQISWMLREFKGTNMMTPLMLGLHLGARSSEVYGLRWSDFDFEKNLVTINKQLQCLKRVHYLSTLKTNNSYRTISFGNVLKNYLLEEKERQSKLDSLEPYKVVYSNGKDRTDMIIYDFVNKDLKGRKMNRNVNVTMTRKCRDNGGFVFRFHNLRHTHATKLLEQGLNPKYIQKRLGHATLDFTLRLYTHITDKMDKEGAEITDKVFNL